MVQRERFFVTLQRYEHKLQHRKREKEICATLQLLIQQM